MPPQPAGDQKSAPSSNAWHNAPHDVKTCQEVQATESAEQFATLTCSPLIDQQNLNPRDDSSKAVERPIFAIRLQRLCSTGPPLRGNLWHLKALSPHRLRRPWRALPLVGILVTLLLGLYNAVQNYRNSKRTTFINTVTSERVKWMDKLRQSISTFCKLAHYWRFSTLKGSDDQRKTIEEIDKLRHLIVLQLDPHGAIDKDV
jgi:hypothetical protein